MRQIVMAGKVEDMSDLRGKEIRTIPLAPELAFWEEVGAVPTPMPALYDAFANGQIDGMRIDFEGTWNTRYHEHADTIIESNHMMFPMIAVGSGRKWQEIGEEDRAVIEAALAEALDALAASYAEIDATNLANPRGTDVDVIRVDRAFFGDAIEAWYEECRETAPMLPALEAEAAALRCAEDTGGGPMIPHQPIGGTMPAFQELRYDRHRVDDLDAAARHATEVVGLMAEGRGEVLSYCERARLAGAELHAGGGVPDVPGPMCQGERAASGSSRPSGRD